jgi:hypothetical protein
MTTMNNPIKWPTRPAELNWAATKDGAPRYMPQIGERVRVALNNLGTGVAEAYFVEAGYLGVKVRLDEPPAWLLKNTGGEPHAYVFGLEIEKI